MTGTAAAEIRGSTSDRSGEVLTRGAMQFLADLHREFAPAREVILSHRRERQERLDAGSALDFLPETAHVRSSSWTIAPVPERLARRRVEITGPAAPAKMVINALNSGADGYMADFEDSLSPQWGNVTSGQVHLFDAVRGNLTFESSDRAYRVEPSPATLHVRPRGWHLPERGITIGGSPAIAALVDFGLFFFHNAGPLSALDQGPYFYLPKLESHIEARLWNEVFCFSQDTLGLDRGTVKATVLIETLPAAFEMDEILYELRDHAAGLNAGRWDYMFSTIKCFRRRSDFTLPDRNAVVMTVPFMRAYTELLVKTCHRRGAHAIGGMAAFLPSRTDESANARALERIRADKSREAGDGFDGSWIAHPDFVGPAMAEFDAVLGDRPNQVDRQRDDVDAGAHELLDVPSTPGDRTAEGLHNDVNVAIQYIASWLGGNGAASIHGLMEDAATAEIARSQVWQWLHHGATLDDGRQVNYQLVRQAIATELERIRSEIDRDSDSAELALTRVELAREIFESIAISNDLSDFLTVPAYEYLD